MSDPREKHSHALASEDVLRVKVKAELRKRLRGLRKTAPIEACAERSAKIVARLEAHPAMQGAKRVALFWPIVTRHEVDLRALDASLRARGARVAYPAMTTPRGSEPAASPMTFRFVDDPASLEEAGYGFAEPNERAPETTELDVVVVPAIAVDPSGHRIGYGAGYYDRTLPRFCPPAVSIAVVYDWQIVAEVPSTPTDVRVRHVVTDVRSFDA